MKKILISACLILTGMIAYAQQPVETDLQNDNLRGKVKSLVFKSESLIEVEDYNYYEEEEESRFNPTPLFYSETFNKDGFLLTGKYEMATNYERRKTYDKDNNLVKDEYTNFDNDNNYYFEYTYENGKLINELCVDEGEPYYISLYEYDNSELIQETVLDGEDGSILVYYKYSWSDDHRTKYTYQIDADDDTLRSYKFEKYDVNNRLEEYCKTGITTEGGFYKYDDKGNQVEIFEFAGGYYGENDYRLYTKEYDDYGNVICEKGYKSSYPDITYHEYEYDRHGNWISRISYDGEEKIPFRKSTREFKYY